MVTMIPYWLEALAALLRQATCLRSVTLNCFGSQHGLPACLVGYHGLTRLELSCPGTDRPARWPVPGRWVALGLVPGTCEVCHMP